MRTTTGRTIFEKPPLITHPVFFTNILHTVESGSKNQRRTFDQVCPGVTRVRNFLTLFFFTKAPAGCENG
jgi:hypothetical protein